MLTIVEVLLLMAVMVLAAQIMILQHHYTEKLSDQAVVLNYLMDLLGGKRIDTKELAQIKDKIFNSSQ